MSSSPAYFIKLGKTVTGPVSADKLPLLWKAGKLPEHAAVSVDKASWVNIQAHLGLYEPEPQVTELDVEDDLVPEEEAEVTSMPPKVSKRPKSLPRSPSPVGPWAFVSMVCWGILMAIMVLGGIGFVVAISQSKNDITIAAFSGLFSTFFIGMYVFVRCIDKMAGIANKM